MSIPDVLSAAHCFAARALEVGDVAIDATVGNGYDTAFLAQQVGGAGQVFGFDVQAEALDRTRARLMDEEDGAPVELIHAGHEQMDEHIPSFVHGSVGAVTFNLGYLPGSDSNCITEPDTTVAALRTALGLLHSGGIITVVVYTGHDGGAAEASAVEEWAADRSQDRVQVLSYSFLNQQNDPPRLLVFEKLREEAFL